MLFVWLRVYLFTKCICVFQLGVTNHSSILSPKPFPILFLTTFSFFCGRFSRSSFSLEALLSNAPGWFNRAKPSFLAYFTLLSNVYFLQSQLHGLKCLELALRPFDSLKLKQLIPHRVLKSLSSNLYINKKLHSKNLCGCFANTEFRTRNITNNFSVSFQTWIVSTVVELNRNFCPYRLPNVSL